MIKIVTSEKQEDHQSHPIYKGKGNLGEEREAETTVYNLYWKERVSLVLDSNVSETLSRFLSFCDVKLQAPFCRPVL